MPRNRKKPEKEKPDSPFWLSKNLSEMSEVEWESLCDGCGRCCLMKYVEEGTSQVFYTNVACSLLDNKTCRCTSYENRTSLVPDCVDITPDNIGENNWLPASCAYRMLYRKQGLSWWHPLVSGDPKTVHKASMSIRHRIISEAELDCEEYEDYIIDWEIGDVPPINNKY